MPSDNAELVLIDFNRKTGWVLEEDWEKTGRFCLWIRDKATGTYTISEDFECKGGKVTSYSTRDTHIGMKPTERDIPEELDITLYKCTVQD